ncbi:MAG: GTPase [Sulfurovum sp.]|nr:MAG: GTPase [Sulfurovum sp.]
MRQIKNSLNLLDRLSNALLPFIGILIIIPVLLLSLLGIYYLYVESYLLYFLAFLVVVSLLVAMPFLLRKKRSNIGEKPQDEISIEISPQWSDFDHQNWGKLEKIIDERVAEGIEWNMMQAYALKIISETASCYHPENLEKELAFTASELLLALEEVSRRYRDYMQEYIPFENKIKLSLIMQGNAHKEKLTFVKHSYDLYRIFRLMNLPMAALSELRGKLTEVLFDNVSNTLQDKIKRAVLKDLASVSIDLYRGHFKMKESELRESKISIEDKSNQAVDIEPLRVVVVGQVSAGKSSLINILNEKMVAEVNIVPSTDQVTVHECKIDGVDVLKLIDLPGLNGDLKLEENMIEQMSQSDLVLWVLKANQSARKLDVQLKKKFDVFYQKNENRSKKRPTIITLVNQVDKLPPANEWNPPYDLANCTAVDKKACTIRDALKYNKELLEPDYILPISLNKDLSLYNIELLKEHIQKVYDDGISTQLNRRKYEHSGNGLGKSAKKLFKGAQKFYSL